MPGTIVDLFIKARWVLPMQARTDPLENHTLIVRDGRIVDLLPHADAAQRYESRSLVERPRHILLPGLVSAHTEDTTLPAIARMLKTGITAFCAVGYHPDEAARAAIAQGLRIVVGLPVAEHPSSWAGTPAEYLTRALSLRDEFRTHPSVGTVFTSPSTAAVSDAAFRRMATLADELDAGLVIPLHESRAAIDASLAQYGMRPLERLQSLGLLTPALSAVHLLHLNSADLELAQRSGIAAIFRPAGDLRNRQALAPAASWRRAGLRWGVGTLDPWTDLKLLTLVPTPGGDPGTALGAWDALAALTSGGAAALGLEAEIGTLERGKWADLCCVDLGGPGTPPPHDPLEQLIFGAGGDLVSDVWVAGRHLLSQGEFTRLDWPTLANRLWEDAS